MNLSMVEVAFKKLTEKKGKMPYIDLWHEVCKELKFTEEQKEDYIAQLYSDLSLDDRFVNLGGKEWDLRSRHTFKEVVVNTEEILDEDDEDFEDHEPIVEDDFN